jgi:hypothetical protein
MEVRLLRTPSKDRNRLAIAVSECWIVDIYSRAPDLDLTLGAVSCGRDAVNQDPVIAQQVCRLA